MIHRETPGGSRVERKKEETKKKILTVAMGLFKEKGFEATTMEHIANEADIAKGTLYNYFPVKEAIIDEYIKRTFREPSSDRISRIMGLPDTRSRLTLLFRELIEGVQRAREYFEKYIVYRMRNMVSFRQDDCAKSGFHLLAAEAIKLGQQNGEIRRDLPGYVLEDLLEFAFVEVVKQFYLEQENFNVDLAIRQCVEVFTNGVKPLMEGT